MGELLLQHERLLNGQGRLFSGVVTPGGRWERGLMAAIRQKHYFGLHDIKKKVQNFVYAIYVTLDKNGGEEREERRVMRYE